VKDTAAEIMDTTAIFMDTTDVLWKISVTYGK
jgi:hypothetical protein